MAVEGNEDALKILDYVRSVVAKGMHNAVAIQYADASGVDTCYVAQSGMPEMWLNGGLDICKRGLLEKLMKRQAPAASTEVHGPIKANRVVFNAANLTLGYDFLAWLVAAEMRRLKYKIDEPLQVGFSVDASWPTRPQDEILARQWDFDHMMLDNVCLPLVKMIGGEAAKKVDETFLWPTNSCFINAVQMFKEGIPVPRLSHDSAAALAMQKHAGKVTITLREAAHWTQRNSDVDTWEQIAGWLTLQGENVVFVRDTAKASEPLGFETEPMASKDINCRAALYAGAKCNLFISNGPGTLDWFCGDAPSLTFIQLSETDGYKCSQRSWWLPHHGIKARGQFPWFPPHKKIVWEYPTFEVVTKAYTRLMNGKVKRRAAKLARAPGVSVQQSRRPTVPRGNGAAEPGRAGRHQ